jgi:hypothetical protein
MKRILLLALLFMSLPAVSYAAQDICLDCEWSWTSHRFYCTQVVFFGYENCTVFNGGQTCVLTAPCN